MPRTDLTEIIFITDRSGSMATCAEAMRQGFDEFINKQKQIPGECQVTAAQFDDVYELLYECKPLKDVPRGVLDPRGSTALHDAIGRTLQAVGQRLAKTPEEKRPGKVVCVIITDGYENASKEYNGNRVRDMITHQRTKYNWEFVFLGASEDAVSVGASLGVLNNAAWKNNTTGSQALFSSVSGAVGGYRSAGIGASLHYTQTNYDVAYQDQSVIVTPDEDDKSKQP
jgi:uncharacterized protein YegL